MKGMMALPWTRRRRHQRLVSEIGVGADSSPENFDDKELELVSWLKIRGEHDACSLLKTGPDKRGLFAVRDIKAGECILRVSRDTMMTADRLPLEFQQLLSSGVSEWAQLALLLLFEKRAGEASIWAPYISCLPRWGTIHSTAFWRKEELTMIQESSLSYETMSRRAAIREEFNEMQSIFQRYEHVFGGTVSYASFKHAYVTVCSRAWRIDGLEKLAMVPFADFMNHDWSSNAMLTYDTDNGSTELFADKNYAAGEQVTISFGPLCNASLALDFGFTVPYNPWDKVQLWLGISRRDSLRKEKLQYLHSHEMLTLTNPDGSDSGGMSFTLREVCDSAGNGRELPGPLFTMARVVCATSSEALLSCDKKQDELKETDALALILTCVETRIQQHFEAILALQNCRSQAPAESTTLLCVEMAEAILGGELRVLRSVSAWLKRQCVVA
ncbi:ribulose-1,5 bisphosphate carboxylase/oxygenase large subunit N-methyltransferase, chloroplastic isoform X1 [Selaginella moellendorffii]|uniref:ribulose-1,5 bisphosphate carboxylase/oxygenase large subunit N-methyltransferase, chloroplastic isoform X1 n=2 Tax=Selaginella moellendorffii TaxID=88036 RepID=UPI000D1CE8C2|nr:ribulose-1,5 bisphosphate carboxylase/oxygenase large subunit N-methyltransferase, chloroplastic isoform X1 [Selaginella moellendorffii]|eukprot:XP_024528299.1 ribulose-1,5 bisphosphate carboxylase/oxygenase large subunit N-methyltransferase, chloroplastic isoform X1 [Selaginella moellendorffii]